MKDYEPLDDNDDPGGQKCAGQHPLQQAIQMTSPQTTFPIGPDTRVPWPCWLWREFSDGSKSWYYYDTGPDFLPITAKFYSTLPASQRPEEPTMKFGPTVSGQKPIGGDEHADTRTDERGTGTFPKTGSPTTVGDVTPLVRSDPVPAATALEQACAEAARETTGAFVQDPGRTIGEFVAATTAILRRHFAPEFERVQREMDEAKNNLEGARRVNARLTQVDFRNADLIEKLQEERDDLRTQLTTLRSAADADRERLDWLETNLDRVIQIDNDPNVLPKYWMEYYNANGIGMVIQEGPTIRAAIDAARAAGREGK